MRWKYLVACWACWLPQSDSRAGELAAIGVAGNDASIQAIKSFYAETVFDINVVAAKSSGTFRSTYWRTPSGVRLREAQGDRRIFDASFTDDRVEIVDQKLPANPNTFVGMKIEVKDFRFCETNPWELSLYSLPVGMNAAKPLTVYSLAELHGSYELVSERMVEEEGDRLLALHYRSTEQGRDYEVFLNQALNWLAVRCIHTVDTRSDSGIYKYTYRVLKFEEIIPTISSPVEVEVKAEIPRYPDVIHHAKIENIKINDATTQLPPLKLPPKGALVLDKVKGISYRIDSNRRTIGKVNRAGEAIVVPAPAVDSTTQQTSPLYGILKYSALLVGVSIVAGLAYKRITRTS